MRVFIETDEPIESHHVQFADHMTMAYVLKR